MKVSVKVGHGYTKELDDGRYLDVSVYPGKWVTLIKMDVWDESRTKALSFNEKMHINFNKFLPLKLAEKLAKHMLNRQSRKVAGVDLI